jgi:hypothetical protein
VLYYIDGYSQQEVAEFLEISLPLTRKWLQRGRDRLRERMLDMVRDNLQADRPSNDERFLQAVKLTVTLEMAALDSQLSVLERVLVDGLDVNAQGKDGRTLLHWAADVGHYDAVELLLRNGADPTLADREGVTPLQLAQGIGIDVTFVQRFAVVLAAQLGEVQGGCHGVSSPLSAISRRLVRLGSAARPDGGRVRRNARRPAGKPFSLQPPEPTRRLPRVLPQPTNDATMLTTALANPAQFAYYACGNAVYLFAWRSSNDRRLS